MEGRRLDEGSVASGVAWKVLGLDASSYTRKISYGIKMSIVQSMKVISRPGASILMMDSRDVVK